MKYFVTDYLHFVEQIRDTVGMLKKDLKRERDPNAKLATGFALALLRSDLMRAPSRAKINKALGRTK